MDDGVLHIPLQVPLIEAVLQDLDPAAEQGVDKVLIGMADLVPVARIPENTAEKIAQEQ